MHSTGWGKLVSASATDDLDELTIDIGPMEIPQYPVFAVRFVERIIVKIKADDIPIVYCRDDFPVVPHLNVYKDGSKALCLFDVPYEDLKYIFNPAMFLQRIIFWFEKTARGELHQQDQPLEPYFPYTKDKIIINPYNDFTFIRLKKIETSFGDLFQEVSIDNKSVGKVYTIFKISIEKKYTENIINKLPSNLGELNDAFDEPIIECIDKCIPELWEVKKTKFFKDLFDEKEKNLRNSEVLLVINIFSARSEVLEPEKVCIKAFRLSDNYQSLYTSFGYRKDEKKRLVKIQEENYNEILLHPFDVLFSLGSNYASILNDQDSTRKEQSFVQIGLGALGSHIANNCIRAGYGRWVYVDNDVLYPHNIARHCLNQNYIGQNKALAMKKYSESILEYDSVVDKVLQVNVHNVDSYEKMVSCIKECSLVVDCSASISVERLLSHTLLGSTRAVSFFLNPMGNALIMLLENSDRSVTLDTLEMQYYRMIAREPKLNDHLQSNRTVLYSSTCRSVSMAYPEDNLSVFAGISSKAIKMLYSNSDPCIKIWMLNDLSIECFEDAPERFETLACDEWTIKLSSSVINNLLLQRKLKLPNETGGVLLGTYDFNNRICYIVDSIDSPSDSQEYPYAYVRGSNGLLEKIRCIEEVTAGNLTYIGEWHSHPNNLTRPSNDDLILLDSISHHTFINGTPGCMLIVGEDRYSIYLKSKYEG